MNLFWLTRILGAACWRTVPSTHHADLLPLIDFDASPSPFSSSAAPRHTGTPSVGLARFATMKHCPD